MENNVYRACISCSLPLTDANTTKYRLKNYIYKCNGCINAEKKAHARKIRSTEEGRRRSYDVSKRSKQKAKKESPKKYTCSQMRSSAKKRAYAIGVDFDLTVNFLLSIAPDYCPVFKEEIKYGGGKKTKFSASLDRINLDKGYVEGNVQIVSNLANMMKNDANISEMKMFADWVFSLQGRTK